MRGQAGPGHRGGGVQSAGLQLRGGGGELPGGERGDGGWEGVRVGEVQVQSGCCSGPASPGQQDSEGILHTGESERNIVILYSILYLYILYSYTLYSAIYYLYQLELKFSLRPSAYSLALSDNVKSEDLMKFTLMKFFIKILLSNKEMLSLTANSDSASG